MRLDRTLKLSSAKPLWRQLAAMRGTPVAVDASGVEHVGALCLQVLLAAASAWERDGVKFEIVYPSPPFNEAVRLMGAALLLPTRLDAAA